MILLTKLLSLWRNLRNSCQRFSYWPHQMISLVYAFSDQLHQSFKDCLDGKLKEMLLDWNTELMTTDSTVMKRKLLPYATLHYLELQKWLSQPLHYWKVLSVGFDGAGYEHKVLGMTISQIEKLRKEFWLNWSPSSYSKLFIVLRISTIWIIFKVHISEVLYYP